MHKSVPSNVHGRCPGVSALTLHFWSWTHLFLECHIDHITVTIFARSLSVNRLSHMISHDHVSGCSLGKRKSNSASASVQKHFACVQLIRACMHQVDSHRQAHVAAINLSWQLLVAQNLGNNHFILAQGGREMVI